MGYRENATLAARETFSKIRLCVIPHANHPAAETGPKCSQFLQLNSAVSRLVWIDVHDLGWSAFFCDTDMNRDFHPYAQSYGRQNQSTMEVDDECLAFAPQRFANTMSLDRPNRTTT